MITVRDERPDNEEHFARLLEFCREVVAIWRDLDIEPVLNGSLAAFGYTQNQTMKVIDDSRARDEWGWRPLFSELEDMVADFINELRTRPEFYGLT